MAKIRLHYIFYGSVQGVGFRWRAYHAARMFGVTGFVRNLPDGSVELEAEGSIDQIGGMIDKIENSAFIRIENTECRDIPVQHSRSFDIKD